MRKENLTYLEHLNTKSLMYKHKIKKNRYNNGDWINVAWVIQL